MLSVQHLYKRFGDKEAVTDLSFEVRAGEIFGLLGQNGAGKTTTLRMILGITAPDRGEILVGGSSDYDRAGIGYLPEERGLFEDATVIHTLEYLGTLRGMSIRGAHDAAMKWLARLDLDRRARERIGALSKGLQQKVQFVGAILHRPALAILDEPFSGLDPVNQELFVDLLRELRGSGMAILLSAHHLELVERLTDRLLLIASGRSGLTGSLADVRREARRAHCGTMRLELGSRGGVAPEPARVAAEIERRFEKVSCNLVPGAEQPTLEVTLPSGHDVGAVVALISEHAAVTSIWSRPPSLHEIYLDASNGSPLDPELAGDRRP